MSDVVRNVTIKLHIQQSDAKLTAPDVSPVTQAAQQIETQFAATFAKMDQQASKTVSHSIQSMAKAHDPNDVYAVKAPEVSPVTAATNAIEASVSSNTTAAGSVKVSGTLSSNLMQAGDAYKMAGEGAFHLARGIAFLNIEGEDELAKVVKKIMFYQGLFDIFKGGVDVVKGLYVGTKALAAAYTVSAVAAAASTGATSSLSIAMAVATGWATAMWTAITGPVGLAVLALTAVVAVGAVAWYKYGGAADAANEKLLKQTKYLDELRAAQYRIIAVNQQAEKSSTSANRAKRERDFDFTAPNTSNDQRIFRLRADQEKLHQQQIKGLLKASDFSGKDQFLGQSAGVAFRGLKPKADQFGELSDAKGFAKFVENASQADKIRKLTQNVGRSDAAAIASGKTKQEQETNLQRVAEKEKANLEAALAGEHALKAGLEQRLAVRQEFLATLDAEKSRLQDMLKLEDDRYKSAQDALKAEAQRNLSTEEKVGKMNPFEQQQLKDIAAKVKAGGIESLQKHERDFLEQNGLAEGKLQRYNINKGKEALKGSTALADLGEGTVTAQEAAGGRGSEGDNKAEMAQRAADAALESRADTSDQLAQVQQQHEKEFEQYRLLLEKLGDLEPLIQTVTEAIAERDRQLENMKVALKESQAAADAEQVRTKYGYRAGPG